MPLKDLLNRLRKIPESDFEIDFQAPITPVTPTEPSYPKPITGPDLDKAWNALDGAYKAAEQRLNTIRDEILRLQNAEAATLVTLTTYITALGVMKEELFSREAAGADFPWPKALSPTREDPKAISDASTTSDPVTTSD